MRIVSIRQYVRRSKSAKECEKRGFEFISNGKQQCMGSIEKK